jgi:flagellum-specific peptidoglycan hydrolase FlgJ
MALPKRIAFHSSSCLMILAISLSVLTGCSSSKKVVKNTPKTTQSTQDNKPFVALKNSKKLLAMSNEERRKWYIKAYAPVAQEEMKRYKIPASITLAQGILESQSGVGELALKSNNHFGIKCHKTWKGPKVYHDDDARGECFRKYKDPRTSFRDHSLFLVNRERYALLFRLKIRDYKGWAKGLKKAGYATDPKYANKLISIIERYNLSRWDRVKFYEDPPQVTSQKKTTTMRYKVQTGDTLYSISKRYNVTVESLQQTNNMSDTSLQIGQELMIIQ